MVAPVARAMRLLSVLRSRRMALMPAWTQQQQQQQQQQ
jgi:hypothetical protein